MSWNDCPDATSADEAPAELDLVLVPRSVDLGEMTVRRALPSVNRQMVGPFIFFDQMGPADFEPGGGIDVRPHPHINLSTLTYLFDGEIFHRDSLGSEQAIRPGAVNLMRAGKGIVHSERTSPPVRDSGQRLFGLQTWMALPQAMEEADPAFTHIPADELPTQEGDGLETRLISGEAFGRVSPVQMASPTLYADVVVAGGSTLPIDDRYAERAVYVIEGEVELFGERYPAGQMIILKRGGQALVTAPAAARVVVVGGEPMDGPRYIWWNFVSSRKERIMEAKKDWEEGRFPKVPGDEEEWIPLPENAGEPRRATGAVHYP